MKLFIMQSFSGSYHFLHLRSKYSPQHPVLTHLESVAFHWCVRPDFTPIQNNPKILILYILIFKFLERREEEKILDRKLATLG
jgi:hypothetical protein